jgi:hypothetical protein
MEGERTACLYCGKTAKETHHIAGKGNDPLLTVDLCVACHQEMHRDLMAMGVQLDSERRSKLVMLVDFLRSLGAHFLALGKRLLDWANLVASIISGHGGPMRETP